MTRILRILPVAVSLGLATSCYNQPYDYGYSSSSYGFSSGGGTAFIHTSSDRWLYDSAVRCYYDRHRGSYYDPWLGGYYPRGYSPRPIYGVPHPYGWNGRGACPLPRNVRYHQIDRYRDRLALIKAQNYRWAQKVRTQRGAAAERFQASRAQAAANFRRAQAVQQDRNQRAREDLQRRNEILRDAYRQPNRGSARPAPSAQPSRTDSSNRGSHTTRNRGDFGGRASAPPPPRTQRAGFNQPVRAVQPQPARQAPQRQAPPRQASPRQASPRQASPRQASSIPRQPQAASRQQQSQASPPPQMNQRRSGGGR